MRSRQPPHACTASIVHHVFRGGAELLVALDDLHNTPASEPGGALVAHCVMKAKACSSARPEASAQSQRASSTLATASRKSFSDTVFLRCLMANMPASVHTLRTSAPVAFGHNLHRHRTASADPAHCHHPARCHHRQGSQLPAAQRMQPARHLAGSRHAWPRARSGCRARSSWCACVSGRSACATPNLAAQTRPAQPGMSACKSNACRTMCHCTGSMAG